MSTITQPSAPSTQAVEHPESAFGDCFSCRVIGTASMGAVGFYALNQSRAHQPGSPFGKRIMGGLGVCKPRHTVAFIVFQGIDGMPFGQVSWSVAGSVGRNSAFVTCKTHCFRRLHSRSHACERLIIRKSCYRLGRSSSTSLSDSWGCPFESEPANYICSSNRVSTT